MSTAEAISYNRRKGLPDLDGRGAEEAEVVRARLYAEAEEEIRTRRVGIAYLQDRDREEWRVRALEVGELEARLRAIVTGKAPWWWNSRKLWSGRQLLEREGRSV